MKLDEVILEGTVHRDGTLELDEALPLPAGRVRVTVRPCPDPDQPNPARFWNMMEQIWTGQHARGHVPRTREEIDAEIQKLRDEAEEEMQAVERLPATDPPAHPRAGEASS